MSASRASFLAALAAAPAATTSRVSAQDRIHLRVAVVPADTFAEAYYAQDMGFFRQAGLDVELISLTSGAAIATAVIAGAADVGITNPMSLATAVLHGIQLRFLCTGGVFDAAYSADVTALCVAQSSTYNRAADLVGQVIAVPSLSDTNSLAVRAWLDQNGGDSTRVRFIETAFSEMAVALQRGTVAAATIPEPLLSQVKGTVARILQPKLYTVFGARFMSGGWFATLDWIGTHRDAARRFIAAIYQTARWANAHHDESAAILAKYSKIDLATIRAMGRCTFPDATTPDLIARVLELAYRYKYLDKLLTPNELIANLAA